MYVCIFGKQIILNHYTICMKDLQSIIWKTKHFFRISKYKKKKYEINKRVGWNGAINDRVGIMCEEIQIFVSSLGTTCTNW